MSRTSTKRNVKSSKYMAFRKGSRCKKIKKIELQKAEAELRKVEAELKQMLTSDESMESILAESILENPEIKEIRLKRPIIRRRRGPARSSPTVAPISRKIKVYVEPSETSEDVDREELILEFRKQTEKTLAHIEDGLSKSLDAIRRTNQKMDEFLSKEPV